MKSLLFYLLIITLFLGCSNNDLNTGVTLRDVKWLMYCLNYQFSGTKLGVIDGPPYYKLISCDFNTVSIDTIHKDTIEYRFEVTHEKVRISLVDTADKREQKMIYQDKITEMSYPNGENVIYGIRLIKQNFVFPIYNRSYVLDEQRVFSFDQLKDSLEIDFINFGESNTDEMTSWLKQEFIKRSKNKR